MRRRCLLPLVLLVAGCGADVQDVPDGRERLDLATRAPQVVVEQSGAIEARATEGFGTHDLGGWLSTPDPVPGGGFAVATRGRSATLTLSVFDAQDRTLELDVVDSIGRSDATDGEPLAVEVRLNTQLLSTAHLHGTAQRVTIDAPAEHWRTGPNSLELRPATVERRDARVDGTEASWYALSLRSVRYAEPRDVVGTESGTRLAPGTSAAWIVEGDGVLEVSGRLESTVDETARVELLVHDRVRAVGRPALVRLPVAVGPDAQEPVHIAYDAERSAPLVVRVSWPSEATAPLFVRELVVEQDAHPLGSTPPIVFVSVDTLAAHALGLYGAERDTSPNLERFAEDAVVFETARANAPWTVPSYASQFTGLMPSANEEPSARGVHDRYRIDRARWTIAELLGARGYACEAIVDNPWLRSLAGVEQGFELFDTEPSTRHLDDVDGGMRLVLPRGIERLAAAERAGRTAFLFLQMLDVHGTYFTPDDLIGRFGSRDVRDGDEFLTVVPDGDKRAGFVHRYVAQSLGEPISESGGERVSKRRLTAAYDEGVFDFDREFGRFVDGLRRQGIYDDAVIVVTADHGEATADDPWPFTHKYPLESTLRVPLIVKLPGSRYGGTRVTDAVTLVDLYPTLAELAGVHCDDERLAGRSLVPLMRGESLGVRPSVASHGGFEARSIAIGPYLLVEYEQRRLSDAAFLSYAPLFDAWKAFDPEVAARLESDGVAPRPDDPWVAGGDARVEEAPWYEALRRSRARFGREDAHFRELFALDAGGATRVEVDDDARRLRVEPMRERLRLAVERADALRLERMGYVEGAAPVDVEELRRLGYTVETRGGSGSDTRSGDDGR